MEYEFKYGVNCHSLTLVFNSFTYVMLPKVHHREISEGIVTGCFDCQYMVGFIPPLKSQATD